MRARSSTSGSSLRRVTPAARWVWPSSSGTSCWTTTREVRSPDGQTGSLLGPAIHKRRDPSLSRSAGRGLPHRGRPGGAPRAPGGADRPGEGVGRSPGADGVRSQSARLPVDHRRRSKPCHAVGDEPEDQVPRVLPALCSNRPAGAGERLLRDGRRSGQPLHAAGGAGGRVQADCGGRRPASPVSTS